MIIKAVHEEEEVGRRLPGYLTSVPGLVLPEVWCRATEDNGSLHTARGEAERSHIVKYSEVLIYNKVVSEQTKDYLQKVLKIIPFKEIPSNHPRGANLQGSVSLLRFLKNIGNLCDIALFWC